MRYYTEVRQVAEKAQRAFIIGGGRVYASMLPDCKRAYVTKVHCTPPSDTFFPNLDADPAWKLTQILQSGEENGIGYDIFRYRRKKSRGYYNLSGEKGPLSEEGGPDESSGY